MIAAFYLNEATLKHNKGYKKAAREQQKAKCAQLFAQFHVVLSCSVSEKKAHGATEKLNRIVVFG